MRIILCLLFIVCGSSLFSRITPTPENTQHLRYTHINPYIYILGIYPEDQMLSTRIIRDSILTNFDKKIEKEKLIQDFVQLLESLKEHPSQFQFIDEVSFENLVNKQRGKLKDSMTVTEFYQIIVPIVTSIGCLHTRLVDSRFFSTPHKYWLPIIVRFEDKKMYAINNCVKSSEMDVGSEILEINGVSTKEIYERMESSISADAFISNFYRGDLNVNFLYYYHSYFGYDSKYEIKFAPYKSEKQITTEFFIEEPAKDYKVKINNTPRLSLEIIKEEETAIIRVKNFSYFPTGNQNIDYFKNEIDTYILKIKEDNLKKIVFDLRGNRGGNPACTTHILSYIADKEILFYEDNELNNSRNRPATISPKVNNISDEKKYFIVDGRCASATTQMLAVIKHNKLAMIIGEETGGTYSNHPGRRIPSLKNTNLSLQLGTERESVKVPKLPLDKGIVPNRIIELNIDDIIRGNDPIRKCIFEESLE